jgi:hypothetical protein
MPYPYAFVRAIAPNYYRVPTKAEQFQYEMSSTGTCALRPPAATSGTTSNVGANDVPLDARGKRVGDAARRSRRSSRRENALFGGRRASDAIPWFFKGGRKIPNIASFKVPEYAVITNRVARKAGLALIGTFVGPNERRFACSPRTRASSRPVEAQARAWLDLPRRRHDEGLGAARSASSARRVRERRYDLTRLAEVDKKLGDLSSTRRPAHGALEEARRKPPGGGQERHAGSKDADLAIAVKPSRAARSSPRATKKWIDISILGQTLVLYEGKKPSTRPRSRRGATGWATRRRRFSTRARHVQDPREARHDDDGRARGRQQVRAARRAVGAVLRGSGYALHAALWHDDFGRPRSHGCINLSPDRRAPRLPLDDPPLPADWHG